MPLDQQACDILNNLFFPEGEEGSKMPSFLAKDPETRYVLASTAQWLDRLLSKDIIKLNDDLWTCLDWCLGGDIQRVFRKVFPALSSEALSDESKETLRKVLERVGNRRGYSHDIEELLKEYDFIKEPLIKIIHYALQEIMDAGRATPVSFRRAQEYFKTVLGLDASSLDLIEFFIFMAHYDGISRYFDSELKCDQFVGRSYLACALAMEPHLLTKGLSQLEQLGLINYGRNTCYAADDKLFWLWSLPANEEPGDLFCRPLNCEVLPLASFPIKDEAIDYVKKILQHSGPKPVHILLYGPPGTGKTSFVRSLAEDLGLNVWSVQSQNGEGLAERRSSLSVTARIARQGQKGLVLADEAENLLHDAGLKNVWPGMPNSHQSMDKSWITGFMEEPGFKIIWVVNHLDQIDDAVKRRFNYSLHFETLGVTERRKMWGRILTKYGAEEQIEKSELESLVRNHQTPAAVMDMAVSQAQIVTDGKNFGPALRQAVEAYDLLLRNGCPQNKKVRSASKYTPLGVSAEIDPAELLGRMRSLEGARQSGDLPAGFGCMLFYGPPGTGKTALARHLAEEMDKELLCRKASDLLSCFVGMTERNIATSFREAEKDGAVLVIDEADSFLYAREGAQHSWEVTQVNEFLTALEECRTFCICTSNRRAALDPATMRRFSFKIGFRYAGVDQIKALYSTLLAPLVDGSLPSGDCLGF